MKKNALILFLFFCVINTDMYSQTINIIAGGFSGPSGINMDENGNIFVAETGTGNNDGKISMIDGNGNKFTIVYGLPSYTDTATHETSGPWRPYVLSDSTLYVIQGKGPDPAAGSILEFNISAVIPGTDSLTISDTIAVLRVSQWALANGFSDSNIFSADLDNSGNAYIADAGANAVLKLDTALNISVLDTFPSIPNTITPFPPFIEYVPTKIISDNNTFYMCNLTGFPFLPGLSQVVMFDTAGTVTPMYSGLTQAVDMQMDNAGNLYVLQFGLYDTSFMPIMNSASIVRISPTGAMDTLATGFGPSAGMIQDTADGFYVTELMTGNVLHISNTTVGINNPVNVLSGLNAFPNPFDESIKLSYMLEESSPVKYTLTDQSGKLIYSYDAGILAKGKQDFIVELNNINAVELSAGLYFMTVTSGINHQAISLFKK